MRVASALSMPSEPSTATEHEDSATLITALRRQLTTAAGHPVTLIETHISWVLLTGECAYKIKKPVRMGFLDCSSLEARRHYCEEELRLNRRLAPTIYLDVVAIRGTSQAPILAPDATASASPVAPIIEYAVRMREFPPHALLNERIAAGTLTPAHIDRLAERIAVFHQTAPAAGVDTPWGTPETVTDAVRAVLERLAAFGARCDAIAHWVEAQIPLLAPVWQQRRRDGHVREVHGDLHLANTVILGEDVTAFDCIEFDPAMRWIDVLSDASFFAMDLHAHRRSDLAWRFLNAYLDGTGDHDGLPVLRFTMVYRALVRAMVARIRDAQAGGASRTSIEAPLPTADDYLALAQRLAAPPAQPALLVTHGLSGSGKTYVSQVLLEAVGALRVRSDVERKRLFGLGALEASAARVPGGIYGAQATERTYRRLLEVARTALRAGYPAIVDAAFLRRAERERFRDLARELGLPFAVLDCQAGAATLRARVGARQARREDASEADLAVLERQFGYDEPLTPDELERALVVHTDQSLDLAALAARWPAPR